MTPKVLIEACVDSMESALAAEASGAERIELCSALDQGGLTPPSDLLAAVCARVRIPVHVLTRPRAGDFVYSPSELEEIREAIVLAKDAGARGIVLGLLMPVGRVDVPRTAALVRLATPLPVTFHRAFDQAADAEVALEDVIGTGATRVLTSGQASSAVDGIPVLAGLVRQAGGRVTILAGGGIREHNVAEIVRGTGVTEVHARTTGDPSLPGKLRRALSSGPED